MKKGRRITFTVTAADIKKGKRFRVCSCPVALAVKRRLRLKRVWVDPWAVQLGQRGYYERFPLPMKVRKWIARFDDGKPVRPMTFTGVPMKSLQVEYINETT